MPSRSFIAALMAAILMLGLSGAPASAQETVEKKPKIVLLFDVSASMGTIDGPAKFGQDPATLPSRLEQIVQFLTAKDKAAQVQLAQKATLTAYRFGTTLDDLDVAEFSDGKTWSAEQWTRWLKADSKISDLRSGTNVAGSALQLLRKEKDSYLQAIVIFSDGRSNRSSKEEIAAFLARVEDRKRPIPVFTIGVGDAATLPGIRIGALQAPQTVRSDELFVVRVPVVGRDLAGVEFQVLLEAERVNDRFGKPLVREKLFLPGPKVGKFTADGDVVEFDIDLKKLKKDATAQDREGTWQITARVPSHPREAFAKSEHVSEPARVVVQDRKPRVLLFAGGATREFQFLRALLQREMAEQRLDLSICVQSADDRPKDTDDAQILKEFPDKIGPKDAQKPNASLSEYDAVVAIDPDWSKLKDKHFVALKRWVAEFGGGVIFVAGPVFTYQVARPGGHDLSALQAIYPVVPRDSRLKALDLPPAPDPTRPYALKFAENGANFPFLKLDDASDSPTAGWNGFFWNDEKIKPDAIKDMKPRRGFFSYYPVDRLKPASQVAAVFAGSKETRIGEKTDAFTDQQPFIVTMPYGLGRTLYLSSGELWRLRAYKEDFHKRLWLGMIDHVANAASGPRGGLTFRLSVPDGELDDVRVDFGKLYQLASKADPVLAALPAEARAKVEQSLRNSAEFSETTRTDEVRWLFFRLAHADAIPLCLEKLPPKQFPKADPPAAPPGDGSFKSAFKDKKDRKVVKVLVIDGEGAKGREEKGDSFFVKAAILSIPGNPYELVFGDELAGGAAAKALERDDLAKFGAIFLLNVSHLSDKQTAQLEKYSQQGGGVAFFLGPLVKIDAYNKSLYKAGKGVFPVPLVNTPKAEAHKPEIGDTEQLLLRDDLFPDIDRYPIFGQIFSEPRYRLPLKYLTVERHIKVDRTAWKPGRAFELATLPNRQAATKYQQAALDILRNPLLKKLAEEPAFKKYQPALERHRLKIETVIGAGSDKKAADLVQALDDMLLDRRDGLTEFWRNPDARIRAVLEDIIRLRHKAHYGGDPLVVGQTFGKGRVIAVTTTAGTQWNTFGGGSANLIFPMFIWETADHLTRQEHSEPRKVGPVPEPGRAPRLLDVEVGFMPLKLTGKDVPKELADAYVVTPDALLKFRGWLADDVGLSTADWIVQVQPVDWADKKPAKILAAEPEQRIVLPRLLADQQKRGYEELMRNVMSGSKDKSWPSGFARTHDLWEEPALDFGVHLARLQAKGDAPQPFYLVKLWLSATGSGANARTSRSEKPLVFLAASPFIVQSEAYRAIDRQFEVLETADAKVETARRRLDDALALLKKDRPNMGLVADRLRQSQDAVQDSAAAVDEFARAVVRFQHAMEMNRVGHNEKIVKRVAASLESLRNPGIWRVEASFNRMLPVTEKTTKETLQKEVLALQGDLKKLDKELKESVDLMSESIVEGKLIDLIRQIELNRLEESLKKAPDK
jgi:hypothetical protein